MSHFSFGFGVGTQSSQGEWLEVFYPNPILSPCDSLIKAIAGVLGHELATGNHAMAINARQTSQICEALHAIDQEEQAKWLRQSADAKQPIRSLDISCIKMHCGYLRIFHMHYNRYS